MRISGLGAITSTMCTISSCSENRDMDELSTTALCLSTTLSSTGIQQINITYMDNYINSLSDEQLMELSSQLDQEKREENLSFEILEEQPAKVYKKV